MISLKTIEGWVKSVVIQTLNRYYPVNAVIIWMELPDKVKLCSMELLKMTGTAQQ